MRQLCNRHQWLDRSIASRRAPFDFTVVPTVNRHASRPHARTHALRTSCIAACPAVPCNTAHCAILCHSLVHVNPPRLCTCNVTMHCLLDIRMELHERFDWVDIRSYVVHRFHPISCACSSCLRDRSRRGQWHNEPSVHTYADVHRVSEGVSSAQMMRDADGMRRTDDGSTAGIRLHSALNSLV
jgi:hypothetical protein